MNLRNEMAQVIQTIIKLINMEFDNKTIIIIGVLLMGFEALFVGYRDLALAVVSGLLGYLTKEVVDYIDNSNQNNQNNEIK